MSPYDNGAMAATLIFVAIGIVSGIASRMAGSSFIRKIGISVALYPVGFVYFGYEFDPKWLAISSVAGLLLVSWSQRTTRLGAHRN